MRRSSLPVRYQNGSKYVLGPAPAPSPARSPAPAADASFHDAKQQVVDAFERGYLEDLMARHDGVVLHAAEEAGLGRNHLARLLRKHGLK